MLHNVSRFAKASAFALSGYGGQVAGQDAGQARGDLLMGFENRARANIQGLAPVLVG